MLIQRRNWCSLPNFCFTCQITRNFQHFVQDFCGAAHVGFTDVAKKSLIKKDNLHFVEKKEMLEGDGGGYTSRISGRIEVKLGRLKLHGAICTLPCGCRKSLQTKIWRLKI